MAASGIRHHVRFLVAVAAGAAAWPLATGLTPALRLVVAGDVFFLVYLALVMAMMTGTTPGALRERARGEDEGIVLIAVLTLVAIGFSMGSVLAVLNTGEGPDGLWLALAVASVPLGWLTLHTLAAHHYLLLFYAPGEAPGKAESGGLEAHHVKGGLEFPGGAAPVAWDFLYFSFVIGMTAQVSDVVVVSRPFRRVVLAHSVASFFFNTVLLAVAVNVAVTQAGGR